MVYAYSVICNNGMVTVSTTNTLEAYESLCFIDSCCFFSCWGSLSTCCPWCCWRDWGYCSEQGRCGPIFLWEKTLTEIVAKWIHIKNFYTITKWDLCQECKVSLTPINQFSMLMNLMTKITWSLQQLQRKEFDKVQHSFMTQILNKPGIEGNFLNSIKAIYKNPQLTLYLMLKIWMLSPYDQD